MAKNMSSTSYTKVADTFGKRAAKEWAQAKAGDGGEHYANARKDYATEKKARQKASELAAKGRQSTRWLCLQVLKYQETKKLIYLKGSDPMTCPDCNGTGIEFGDGGQCDRCDGTGEIQ